MREARWLRPVDAVSSTFLGCAISVWVANIVDLALLAPTYINVTRQIQGLAILPYNYFDMMGHALLARWWLVVAVSACVSLVILARRGSTRASIVTMVCVIAIILLVGPPYGLYVIPASVAALYMLLARVVFIAALLGMYFFAPTVAGTFSLRLAERYLV